MRYYMAMFLLLSLTLGCDGDGPLKPGEFEDPAFKACVEKTINSMVENDLVSRDDPELYNKINMIGCGGGAIRSIKGIENIPNIDWFGASDNQIESLEPLRTLTKLEFLKLSNNKIKDLEPLSGLPVLGALFISENYVANISPLYAIPSLNSLSVWGNCITDLSQFDELKKENPDINLAGDSAEEQTPEKCQ